MIRQLVQEGLGQLFDQPESYEQTFRAHPALAVPFMINWSLRGLSTNARNIPRAFFPWLLARNQNSPAHCYVY